MAEKNLGASVRSKLKNKAQAENKEFNLILTRYALERFLYRLSISEHRNQFLLKGALLFDLWFDVPLRPTRDIDLLGFQLPDASYLLKTFEDLCDIQVEDGVTFDRASIRAEEIRKEANYSGMRMILPAYLDGARSVVQVDIGFGDAVTPAPEVADYPVLLKEFPNPRLRIYPRYTVVAEKLDAIISLGMTNTRMKDYFDIWIILRKSELDSEVLRSALMATVKRRSTLMPEKLPLGLSDEFAQNKNKNVQWNAFLTKNQLDGIKLNELVMDLRSRLEYLFIK